VVTQTTAFGKPEAQITRFVYDAHGHLRQVTDAAGNVSADDYDADYNRIASTDENGNTTTYGYDALNRQIRVTDALGGEDVHLRSGRQQVERDQRDRRPRLTRTTPTINC
jgi:YD repeat-containing protein